MLNVNVSIESPSMTCCLMTMVMCALSLTFYAIFANQIKCKNFDLDMKDQSQAGEKQDLRHSTGLFESILKIFQNFSYPATYVYE